MFADIPQDPLSRQLDPRVITRRTDAIMRKLYGPFVVIVVAIALFATARACQVAPPILRPIVEQMPQNIMKNVLLAALDAAEPIGHYAAKLAGAIRPVTQTIWDWFCTTAHLGLKAFTDWVESL